MSSEADRPVAPLEPVPATAEAVDELDPAGEDDLLGQLRSRSAQVRRLVPECVGISITLIAQGLTFTLVATDAATASLDAVQYLDGGPCAEVASGTVGSHDHDDLAEQQWHLLADATAACGVASTLTLPILDETGGVVSSVNLYGSTPHCFDLHHQGIAEMFDAWAPGAVTNADLSFSTRRQAEQAPGRVRAQALVDVAIGYLAARDGISAQEASAALHEAAARAGIDPSDLAEAVLRAAERDGRDTPG